MPPQSSAPRRLSLEWASVWALIATIIIAAVVVLPTVAFPLIPTKSFVLAAGVLVTLAAWILARLSRGNIILPPVAILAALWLPALAYALSAAFAGGSFAVSTWGTVLENDTFGFILTVSALGTLTALVVRRSDHYHAFLRVVAVALGAFVGLAALIVIAGQIMPSVVSPAFPLAGSVKDVAAVLGFAVFAVLLAARFAELSGRAGRVLLAIGFVALVLLAVLNISLVWILLAVLSLGLFVEAIMTRRPGAVEAELEDAVTVGEEAAPAPEMVGARSFVMPLIVLVISLFFLIGGNLGNALASVFHTGTVDVRPSWSSTLAVGTQVYDRAPIFGSGPGSFGVEWLKYRDASLNSTIFWNVDFATGIGFIPTSAVTTGIVGVLAWLGLIGLFLFYGLRMLVMRAPEDPLVQFTSIMAFVAALYFLAIAFFDEPGPVVLALTFVSLGLFASTMRYARGARQWGVVFARSPRLGFVIVFTLTLFLLGAVGAAYALVEHFVAISELSRANAAYAAGNLDQADTLAKASLSFAPIPTAYTIEATVANGELVSLLSETSPPANAQQIFQTTISNGISAALTATKLSPSDPQAWTVLGSLYGEAVPLGVSGAYDSAKKAYQQAMALDPTNPQLYYLMAQLDIANKDNAMAETDLRQAITLKNDYTQAILLLSQLLVADGNIKDALTAAEAAAYFTPNDPNILFEIGVLSAASGNLNNATIALQAAVSANSSFANARYFLAAVLAKQGNYSGATAQLEAIAALSSQNATAVAPAIATLAKGQDPFPPNLLSVSPTPASPAPASRTQAPSVATSTAFVSKPAATH